MLEQIESNKVYRNKKNGKHYMVKDFVMHSETLEPMVLYFCLHPSEDDRRWARPYQLFLEKFEEVEG